jgi:hypothetical protein
MSVATTSPSKRLPAIVSFICIVREQPPLEDAQGQGYEQEPRGRDAERVTDEGELSHTQ